MQELQVSLASSNCPSNRANRTEMLRSWVFLSWVQQKMVWVKSLIQVKYVSLCTVWTWVTLKPKPFNNAVRHNLSLSVASTCNYVYVLWWCSSLLGAGPVFGTSSDVKMHPGCLFDTLTGMAEHQQCEREQSVFPLAAMGQNPKSTPQAVKLNRYLPELMLI